MIDLSLEAFNEFRSTFKEVSFDKENKEYMTALDIEAINFDNYVKELCHSFHWKASFDSVDSLWSVDGDDTLYLIEFKNGGLLNPKGEIQGKTFSDIRHKLNESVLVLTDSLKVFPDCFRTQSVFILVYNDDKNKSLDGIQSHLARRAGKPIIRFGMDRFCGSLFSDVRTLTVAEFERFVNGKIDISE